MSCGLSGKKTQNICFCTPKQVRSKVSKNRPLSELLVGYPISPVGYGQLDGSLIVQACAMFSKCRNELFEFPMCDAPPHHTFLTNCILPLLLYMYRFFHPTFLGTFFSVRCPHCLKKKPLNFNFSFLLYFVPASRQDFFKRNSFIICYCTIKVQYIFDHTCHFHFLGLNPFVFHFCLLEAK